LPALLNNWFQLFGVGRLEPITRSFFWRADPL
jgi:hypothetical protein